MLMLEGVLLIWSINKVANHFSLIKLWGLCRFVEAILFRRVLEQISPWFWLILLVLNFAITLALSVFHNLLLPFYVFVRFICRNFRIKLWLYVFVNLLLSELFKLLQPAFSFLFIFSAFPETKLDVKANYSTYALLFSSVLLVSGRFRLLLSSCVFSNVSSSLSIVS